MLLHTFHAREILLQDQIRWNGILLRHVESRALELEGCGIVIPLEVVYLARGNPCVAALYPSIVFTRSMTAMVRCLMSF